jgi:hypothetical protein
MFTRRHFYTGHITGDDFHPVRRPTKADATSTIFTDLLQQIMDNTRRTKTTLLSLQAMKREQ